MTSPISEVSYNLPTSGTITYPIVKIGCPELKDYVFPENKTVDFLDALSSGQREPLRNILRLDGFVR